MERLILQPNSTSLWQSLVGEACNNCNILLPEDMESYLVFLLMRFTKDANIAKKIVALDFITGQKQTGQQKQNNLRDVGDICLLFSGFFPERAIKRRVKVSYYVTIGRSAYNNLGQNNESSLANLFTDLSDSFVPLMDVLQTMRNYNSPETAIDPLIAEEILAETGSTNALNILRQYTSSDDIILQNHSTNNTPH